MSLVDRTYFVRDINLPSSAFSDLDSYIETYEKEMLVSLLGYDLYTEFMAALAAEADAITDDEGNVITPAVIADQKWLDLRDGKTYTYAGRSVRWNGLINSDKVSPIAYYVFCKYVVAKQVTQSNTGANIPKQENSVIADNTHKVVSAWNSFIKLYGYNGQSEYEGSALNFLLAHSDTYDSYTQLFEPANIYGL